MARTVEFSIEHGDILAFEADVIALKYAQKFYGADAMVATALTTIGLRKDEMRPPAGDYKYFETGGAIAAPWALFVGVPELWQFDYGDIRELAARTLGILVDELPGIRHLAMTIHGARSGLDEIETLRAQFAGFLEAIQADQIPSGLEHITIVDRDSGRVERLRLALDKDLANANYASRLVDRWGYQLLAPDTGGMLITVEADIGDIKRAGEESETKPYAFVAMPFSKDLDDVFYYGIQGPIRDAGFLCERMDRTAFTGDIVEQIKKQIETASVVVAELTGGNPNVFLEVGYAWGVGRPTILVVNNLEELPFDVRGQRCLTYERIRDLEDALADELQELRSRGIV